MALPITEGHSQWTLQTLNRLTGKWTLSPHRVNTHFGGYALECFHSSHGQLILIKNNNPWLTVKHLNKKEENRMKSKNFH